MNYKQTGFLIWVVLFFTFWFMGIPYLSSIFDPHISRTAVFRGEEIRVNVHHNRKAIAIKGGVISKIDIFEEKNEIVARTLTPFPRSGNFLITTRIASVDEKKLFHQFF